MAMRVEIRAISDLSSTEQELLDRERARIDYGVPNFGFRWTRGEWCVLTWCGESLASHVGVVERTITVGAASLHVGGISGVWTVPEMRGRGFASAALGAAVEFLRDERKVEFGLLLCVDRLIPFYERLGWIRVPGPLVFDQPNGKTTWPQETMVRPILGSAWPAGTIDLRGLPW